VDSTGVLKPDLGGSPQHDTLEKFAATPILLDTVDEHDALFAVDFAEPHFDDFRGTGLHVAADVLRFDRHFAMAALDKDTERDAPGAAEVEKAVHGGADGAAGVEDVVHEDEVHVVNAEGNIRRLQHGLGSDLGKVVAIKSDVQGADGNINAVDAAHGARDALGQGHAAAAYADKGEMFGAARFFHDFVGQALKRAVDFGGGHQLRFFNDTHGRVIVSFVTAKRSTHQG
jgi:hypothetical protein